MAVTTRTDTPGAVYGERAVAAPSSPVRQAYRILHIAFVVIPLLAGLDKFTNIMTDWTQYLAPVVLNVANDVVVISPRTFMYVVGVIEVFAAFVVLIAPRIGGWLVAAWLWGIIVNLFLHGQYYDIAARDFGLSLGAVALARLASAMGKR